jgi:hypothetical protein
MVRIVAIWQAPRAIPIGQKESEFGFPWWGELQTEIAQVGTGGDKLCLCFEMGGQMTSENTRI